VLDCTIWPVSAGAVDVVETPQFTFVAGGRAGGFSIEPALAPMLFARWLAAAHNRADAIRLSVADPQAWANALGAEQRLAHFVPRIDDPEQELARVALAPPDYAPDLRQGPFAPAAAGGQQPWRLWRFAAALALLALLLQIGGLVVAGLRDAEAAQRTLALAERDFRAARPEVRRIVNLRAQVAALVNAAEQAGDHPVLAVTDPLIRVQNAHPLVRLDEVRHAAPGRTVHLRLSSPQGPALEAAIAEIGRQGFRTEARGLQPIEGRYTTELVLESP
jgi:type II secretory pathway component PulL